MTDHLNTRSASTLEQQHTKWPTLNTHIEASLINTLSNNAVVNHFYQEHFKISPPSKQRARFVGDHLLTLTGMILLVLIYKVFEPFILILNRSSKETWYQTVFSFLKSLLMTPFKLAITALYGAAVWLLVLVRSILQLGSQLWRYWCNIWTHKTLLLTLIGLNILGLVGVAVIGIPQAPMITTLLLFTMVGLLALCGCFWHQPNLKTPTQKVWQAVTIHSILGWVVASVILYCHHQWLLILPLSLLLGIMLIGHVLYHPTQIAPLSTTNAQSTFANAPPDTSRTPPSSNIPFTKESKTAVRRSVEFQKLHEAFWAHRFDDPDQNHQALMMLQQQKETLQNVYAESKDEIEQKEIALKALENMIDHVAFVAKDRMPVKPWLMQKHGATYSTALKELWHLHFKKNFQDNSIVSSQNVRALTRQK